VKWLFAALLLTACAWSQTQSAPSSAELLFVQSDSAAALRATAKELARNPADVNALLVRMEASRLQLRPHQELHAALALLRTTHGEDLRAELAACRLGELAAKTPAFRAAVPQLVNLLQANSAYSREVSSALLSARADGVSIPVKARLTRRFTQWQVAGPFGEYANIDFDQSWAPESDQLQSPRYAGKLREEVLAPAGELELPNYFPDSGVYYAASNVRIAAGRNYRLVFESDGTFDARLDGELLLLHDARLRSQKRISMASRALSVGNHRLLLKLQRSAFPIRVWIEAESVAPAKAVELPEAERSYLNSAIALFEGDAAAGLAAGTPSGSVQQMLRAQALAHIEDEQKQREALLSSVKSDSGNLLATLTMAQRAIADDRLEEATLNLAKVLQASPEYWPAQELKYQLATRMGWEQEREAALKMRLRLHPDCGTYLDALKNQAKPAIANVYLSRLSHCAAVPTQYWTQLSERGEHERALASLSVYLRAHALDRSALEKAIREAVLAGDNPMAQHYAKALHRSAPNWEWASALVSNPQMALDSRSAYAPAGNFYEPYVRDTMPAMAESPDSAVSSRVLINDRVVRLLPDGSAWVYQHTVTQVFDKKGIESAGEVELPRSADRLELRTIKPDGTYVEPESNDGKSSVSMASLSPGAAVELAYVQHFRANALRDTPELLDFVFGSAESPTRSARMTMIREGVPEPRFWHSPQVREREIAQNENSVIIRWEAENLAPTPQEPSSPRFELSPRILCLGMDDARGSELIRRYRDELVQATKITIPVQQIAMALRGSSSREQVASAYQYVMANIIEDTNESWRSGTITSATDSLEQGQGNRAVALISVLSALGFDAELALAAERGSQSPEEGCPVLRCYTHPVVRVMVPDSETPIFLDTEMQGVAAGAMSPEIEGQPAISISRLRSAESTIAQLPRTAEQRSRATANLDLDESGAIHGTLRIRFGSLRGAQMRENLRQLSGKERQAYLEEIAGRILPNARNISGVLLHERDPESPLELELKIGTSTPSQWSGSNLELGQIIPALGLGRLYATLPQRQQDLLLETPLIEDAEFVVHLPSGMEGGHLPKSVSLKSRFGEYSTRFKIEDRALKISRSFRIPAQQIAPAEYPSFSRFALQIDSAEHELVQLRSKHQRKALPAVIESLH
jgi:uncharacterized protein DUF3858